MATSVPPLRGHTPDIALLIRDPHSYILLDNSRLVYLVAWAALLILLSSALSAAFAYRLGFLDYLSRRFAPAVTDVSGWYRVFDTEAPENSTVYVMCELVDGSYAAGDLAWYNTDPEDSPDRDLILAPPLTLLNPQGEDLGIPVERVILSARDMRQIYVVYAPTQERPGTAR